MLGGDISFMKIAMLAVEAWQWAEQSLIKSSNGESQQSFSENAPIAVAIRHMAAFEILQSLCVQAQSRS